MRHQSVADQLILGTVKRRVDMVEVGDHLDLQGDEFADPENDREQEFGYEFAVVEEIECEWHDIDPTIVLHTSQGSFGFPIDHWIEVDGEQTFDEVDNEG